MVMPARQHAREQQGCHKRFQAPWHVDLAVLIADTRWFIALGRHRSVAVALGAIGAAAAGPALSQPAPGRLPMPGSGTPS